MNILQVNVVRCKTQQLLCIEKNNTTHRQTKIDMHSCLKNSNVAVSNCYKFIASYSLKLNELIQFSQAGVFIFFSTQFLLRIPIFELNIPFMHYRTIALDIQSLLEFLQLIHNFLPSNITLTPSVYMHFPLFRCFV